MSDTDISSYPRFGILVTTHCLVWDIFLQKSVDGCLEGCPDSLTVRFCCLLIDVSGKLSEFLLESLIVGSMVLIHRRGVGDFLVGLKLDFDKKSLMVGDPRYISCLIYQGVVVCQEQI